MDSQYQPGAPISPDVEARVGCEALVGAQFTLGSGRDKKGPLSTVTGAVQLVPSRSTSVRCSTCRAPSPRTRSATPRAPAIASPRARTRSSTGSDAV